MDSKEYIKLLSHAKEQIQNAQLRTISAANSQMLLLYWQMGNLIIENQQKAGWGAKIISMLSTDLKKEFPTLKGFSSRNLKYMRKFASEYSPEILEAFAIIEQQLKQTNISQKNTLKLLHADKEQFVQQTVAQIQFTGNHLITIVQQDVAQLPEHFFLQTIVAKISWSHQIVLMNKEPHIGKRLWYMLNSLEHGISRNMLAMQIESHLFERQLVSKKTNNFKNTLPPIQSDFVYYPKNSIVLNGLCSVFAFSFGYKDYFIFSQTTTNS